MSLQSIALLENEVCVDRDEEKGNNADKDLLLLQIFFWIDVNGDQVSSKDPTRLTISWNWYLSVIRQ